MTGRAIRRRSVPTDAGRPAHQHDGDGMPCADCARIIDAYCRAAVHILQAALEGDGPDSDELQAWARQLVDHGAYSYAVQELAVLAAALAPGTPRLAWQAGGGDELADHRAAVTVVNELLAAGRASTSGQDTFGPVWPAVWAVSAIARLYALGILGHVVAELVGSLPRTFQSALLMMLSAPLPACAGHVLPPAAGITALMADGRDEEASQVWAATLTTSRLAPTMLTAWASTIATSTASGGLVAVAMDADGITVYDTSATRSSDSMERVTAMAVRIVDAYRAADESMLAELRHLSPGDVPLLGAALAKWHAGLVNQYHADHPPDDSAGEP